MSVCRKCGESVVWALSRNGRWVPVQPSSINASQCTKVPDPEDPNRTVNRFDPSRGHEAHFEYCNLPPPPPKQSKHKELDPYSTLYLLSTAPPVLVTKVYKVLAAMHHPDTGGSTEKMQQINAAYLHLKKFGLAS